MRKFVTICSSVLVTCSMIFTLLSPASLAAENTSMGAIKVSSFLNVRSAPDVNSSIVGKLVTDDVVKIIGKTGDWYEISLNDQNAYVSTDYVQIITSDKAAQLIQAAKAKAAATPAGQKIVNTAKEYIGTPYVYGGRSENGFDCSGFTGYVYEKNGVSIPRTSSDQAKVGTWVDKSNLKAGDLVFFNCNGSGISHVGIYVGNNQFIHSPRTGETVTIESLSGYYDRTYCTARRVVK